MTSRETPRYYHEEPPPLSEGTKELFMRYAKIPEGEIVGHLKEVRDKAWSLFQYPCIGGWSFLEFKLQDLPVAEEVISRMKTGSETLLDLGCCFGQDIRQLVFFGAPSQNTTGFDLKREFIDFGYELFRDRETLKTEFVVGDFFDEASFAGKEETSDLISASAFFHLFDWEGHIEAVSKAVRILKPKNGSMIFGRQAGTAVADSYPHSTSRSGEMYRHDDESFKRMVSEVAKRTGRKLEAETQVGEMKDETLREEGFNMFTYSIRMVG